MMNEILTFFSTSGAFGGLIGGALAVAGSYFAVLDLGVRRSTPLYKEPVVKQIVYVICGMTVGAALYKGHHKELGFLVYLSAGAGWLYVVKGFTAASILIGNAIEKGRLLASGVTDQVEL